MNNQKVIFIGLCFVTGTGMCSTHSGSRWEMLQSLRAWHACGRVRKFAKSDYSLHYVCSPVPRCVCVYTYLHTYLHMRTRMHIYKHTHRHLIFQECEIMYLRREAPKICCNLLPSQMETPGFSSTLLPAYQTEFHHIRETDVLNTHYHKNFSLKTFFITAFFQDEFKSLCRKRET